MMVMKSIICNGCCY